MGMTLPERADGWPSAQPAPAFGDVMGGLTTAGAIAAALLKRERTSEPSVVDVSLLATAMWQLSPLVVASKLFGFSKIPQGDRTKNPNPGVSNYKTKDGRFISLILLQSDKFWADLVTRLGLPDMVTDERFVDSAARAQNAEACIVRLDEAFGSMTLAELTEAFDGFEGVWATYQTLDELYEDPQVIANGYLPSMTAGNGQEVQLVASPAQFDETAITVERAPEHGEHTELLLMDLGYDWDQIAAMKESGAIL
jgi:crotonobetainyl-CoA:carnitine CoA-transferase CaiB-like acyl-CoA transferase